MFHYISFNTEFDNNSHHNVDTSWGICCCWAKTMKIFRFGCFSSDFSFLIVGAGVAQICAALIGLRSKLSFVAETATATEQMANAEQKVECQ